MSHEFSLFLTSKYPHLFYITTAASQLQILIISYHSKQLIVLIYVQHLFILTVSYAQVIFLRGKTHQITSLQNILKLLLKFTGLNSNLLGEFANTIGFFACFSCSISSDFQSTILDQWYFSFYIFIYHYYTIFQLLLQWSIIYGDHNKKIWFFCLVSVDTFLYPYLTP